MTSSGGIDGKSRSGRLPIEILQQNNVYLASAPGQFPFILFPFVLSYCQWGHRSAAYPETHRLTLWLQMESLSCAPATGKVGAMLCPGVEAHIQWKTHAHQCDLLCNDCHMQPKELMQEHNSNTFSLAWRIQSTVCLAGAVLAGSLQNPVWEHKIMQWWVGNTQVGVGALETLVMQLNAQRGGQWCWKCRPALWPEGGVGAFSCEHERDYQGTGLMVTGTSSAWSPQLTIH